MRATGYRILTTRESAFVDVLVHVEVEAGDELERVLELRATGATFTPGAQSGRLTIELDGVPVTIEVDS